MFIKGNELINLGNSSLEYLKVISFKNSIETEVKILEKILTIKTLKEIIIDFKYINDDLISKIEGENNSVNRINMVWNTEECILYNFQKKFPNISELNISTRNSNYYSSIFEINENPKYKINKLTISNEGNSKLKLYCGPFENLIEFELYHYSEIKNIKNFFPIFRDNCNTIFISLITLKLNFTIIINNDIINNIFNNIDKMPRLQHFSFNCFVKYIDEDLYKQYINKILSLKLISVELEIKKEDYIRVSYYSLNELKDICSKINTIKINKIIIRKWDF